MKRGLRPAWFSFRAMLKQQFLLLTRYPVNLGANFLLVLVAVVAVTLMVTLFVPRGMETQLRGVTLYGFVIYIFLSHSLWTVGMGVQKEKLEGTLVSLYLTPASRFLTLLARSVVALGWTGVAAVLGLLLAQALTGPLVIHRPWLALGILLMTVGGLIGLGFTLAGLALRFGESIEIVANILEFGLAGLCAFFFPFSVLPPTLQTVARLIPLSYAVDAFRSVLMGRDRPELLDLNIELAIILLTGVLGPFLGYGIYLFNERQVRQRGTL